MSTVQPVWVTPAGSLGTVPEGTFYQVPLQVEEPPGDTVYYRVIAGSLPTGVVCDPNTGVLTGIPAATFTAEQDVEVSGVDITSKFAIRAYTTTTVGSVTVIKRLADRTFTITVAGQNFPEWITPPGELGEFFDGSLLVPGLQLEYFNTPTPGVPPISLVAGALPPGLSISDTGLISGFIESNPDISVAAGFARDNQGFDQYPFDFNTRSPSYNYEFVLKVTDGRASALRTFTMFVWSTDVFSADTTLISADNTVLTASISSIDAPVILNPQGSIGSVQNDNFFAYQFIGREVNNNALGYIGYDLPPGLELNTESGYLYGYIPNLGLTELTYDFSVRVYNYYNPAIISNPYNFSLTTIGPISTNITWLVPDDLGVIANGAASMFYVAASNTAGLALEYRLQSGSNSRLPQGLTLLPSGNIVGRVSFDNFSLDNNTTIFDNQTTTFDLTYTFTVNAYSVNGLISVSNTFTIRVDQVYGVPYNNLYIECMPPVDDRELIISLVQDATIFPPALIYRADDPNFGVAKNVVYDHAFGLTAATLDDYVAALDINHYWKNLVLGSIKTAQALDDAGQVVYEVVYSEVIDNMVNSAGEPVGKEVLLAYPVDPNTPEEIDVVFPNALDNMRDQVIDSVGQVSQILPLWMQSNQANGQVLGFTPAWVIAYTNPGASGQIAYNIQQQFGTQLNLVDFKADRYEIDRSMTNNWDPEVLELAITGITANGTQTVVSFATQIAPPFGAGEMIQISNTVPATFDGTFYVSSCTTGQVTFASSRTGIYISSGTVASTPTWIPSPPTLTTFDRTAHTQLMSTDLTINFYSNDVFDSATVNFTPGSFDSSILPGTGSGYAVGDQIKVFGTQFVNPATGVNGTSPENDFVVEVTQIQDILDPGSEILGQIVATTVIMNKDIAPPLSAGTTWNITSTVNLIGSGTGAVFVITSVPGVPTTFDGGSIQFTDPADTSTNTNEFDRYLLFPRKDILTPVPTYDGLLVGWDNNSSTVIPWVNNLGQVVGWVNTDL